MHTSIYLSIANILTRAREKGKIGNQKKLLAARSSEEAEEGEDEEDKDEGAAGKETRKGRSRQIGSDCFVAEHRFS